MKEFIELLLYLGLAVLFNIAMGCYKNIGKSNEKFDKAKLFNGIKKAVIICFGFISCYLLYGKLSGMIDLGDLSVEPRYILLSAILLYWSKGLVNLKDSIGIKIESTKIEKDSE